MQTYQVKTGDTLISIARQWMGTGDAWRLIAQLNGLGDPSQLKVGQTLNIPVTDYVVQSGDSLRRIAQRELGTEAAWKNIAVLNNITDPRFLVIGQVLRLPVPIQTGVVNPGANGKLGNGPSPVPSDSEPQTSSGNERSYTVQRGDSLITIAQKTLGDRSRWREIALRNNITNPADLRVGTLLKLPPLKGANPVSSQPLPPVVPPAMPAPVIAVPGPASPVTAAQPPRPMASPETTAQPAKSWNYTVVRGDTLIGIARKTLANGNRWPDIAELNRLASPRDLRVGMVLRIPGSQPALSQPAPAQPVPSQPETAAPGETTRNYQVQQGDTLIKIARKTLGDGDRWREIALLNNIIDTRDLLVGMTLKIPASGNSSAPADPVTPNPVSPSPANPANSGYDNYAVQRGDTLIKIARKTLNSGDRWQDIARLNRIVDTRDLRVGMTLKIPRPNSITPPSAEPTPKPEIEPSPTEPTPTQYKVQRGDTLMGIARKTLGNGDRWQDIASLNNIERPSDLRVGMVLKIPAPASGVPLPTAPTVPSGSAQPGSGSDPIPSGPSTYRVQPGDSLYSIAANRLGDRARWSEIGRLNSLPDPSKLRVGTLLLIPGRDGDPGPQPVASILSAEQDKAAGKLQSVKFTTRQDNVFAQWVKSGENSGVQGSRDSEERVGVLYQKGLFRRGEAKPRDFIQFASSLLRRLRLSDSEMNAIAAISDNEGYLDAVNTWDSQYLSFGLFQWTAGSVERPGELAALLTRLKQTYPDEFQHYFGQFGLDVEDSNGVRGWIALNGVRLNNEYQKSLLRQPIWAYRFARAGQDTMVKSVQIRHAVDRIDRFYFIRHNTLDGYSLSDLIQSEFGVTLLLDNHVNRPAYVVPGVVRAMQQLGITPEALASGSTETELRVLERYLDVRQTYGSKPMTHAKTRGDRISRQVREGRLSQERGSFVSNKNQRVG